MLFDKVSELCKSNGTTIWKLEKKLGFANASISRWKKAYPSADRLSKVADFFNVSVDDLLERETIKLSDESMKIATTYDQLPADKKDLMKCYMSVLQAK